MARLARLVLALGFATAPCLASPTEHAPPCARGPSGSLSELACGLVRGLGANARNAVVVGVTAPPSSSTPLQPGIAVNMAVKVALALGRGASAWPRVEDRAGLGRFLSPRPLVVVETRLAGDRVEASAQLFAPRAAPSSGAPGPAGEPLLRVTERHGIDAETHVWLPPVAIARREFFQLGPSDGDVVALACGDLDGSGVPTLASIGRTFVTLGTLAGGKYAPGARREERALAPVAPVPLREPLATAWITPDRSLDFGLSDRAHATRLAEGGQAVGLAARLPWPGGGCATLDGLLVAPRVAPCTQDEPPRNDAVGSEPLDAIAGAVVVRRDGSARVVRAGREAKDGAVVVTDGAQTVRLEHAGAAIAIADLDGDGAPELVTSVDTLDPRADAVIVYSWLGAGLTERFRVEVPAGVKALALCPEVADRMASIVMATNVGLWAVR
ncbi:MAG TPA: hypothetical protein VMI54_29995 [Polyangiaceae bacterium]|nr:hypothetical protein [Polyangiaceae bacterium]